MATRVEQDELSELASFVIGLARAVARDADRLHRAATLIRQARPENARAMTEAALPVLRQCCRSLTDCVFHLRSTVPPVEPAPDSDDADSAGGAP